MYPRLIILAALPFLALTGCATVGERTNADGSHDIQIVCGGASGVCESKAASLCPSGYRTISKTFTAIGWEQWVHCNSDVAGQS